MASSFMLRCLFPPYSTYPIVIDDSDTSGMYLKHQALYLTNCTALEETDLTLYHDGRIVRDTDQIQSHHDGPLAVDVCPKMLGGKGGFGSMLRALGAQMERTTNKEACRDLSGRRMRDVKAQKTMAEWAAKEADREREKAERKKEKMQRLLDGPKHHFDDKGYTSQIQQNAEKMQDAVLKGLSSSSGAVAGLKRTTDPGAAVSSSKKPKGWLGFDEAFNDDSSGDDNEVKAAGSHIDEASADTPNVLPGEVAPSMSTDSDKPDSLTGPTADPIKGKEASSETNSDAPKGKASKKRKRGETKSIEAILLDLSDVTGVADLEALGRERLKSALHALGLKYGGTLEQLATRLFSTKDVPLTSFDPSLFAKPHRK